MCGLNIGCLVWQWFTGLGLLLQLAIGLSLAMIVWGVVDNLVSIARRVGGWQAAVGMLGLLGVVLLALWPWARGLLGKLDGVAPPAPVPRRRGGGLLDSLTRKRNHRE